MGNCKDCRWWEPIDLYGDGKCLALAVTNAYPSLHGGRYSLTLSSPSSSNLVTGELFGCMKFEPKG